METSSHRHPHETDMEGDFEAVGKAGSCTMMQSTSHLKLQQGMRVDEHHVGGKCSYIRS